MASYMKAVAWIANEDAPGDDDDVEILSGYLTVCLVADLFDKEPGKVAADVHRYRVTHKTKSIDRYDEGMIYRAQACEDARAKAEGRKPRLIETMAQARETLATIPHEYVFVR